MQKILSKNLTPKPKVQTIKLLTQPGLVLAKFLVVLLLVGIHSSFANPQKVQQKTNLNPANQLANHPSKYLAAHAADPINWRLYQADTLQFAQQTNQLILVSSGYFACHWCHVMQQENYQNQQVAKILNQNFVAIKLDRELHPELDTELLEFARATTGRAGWPLHVVLTPDFKPLAAFVYQPTQQLIKTLNLLTFWWQNHQTHLRKLADNSQNIQHKIITKQDFQTSVGEDLLAQIDNFNGGFNASQKFPHSPVLLSLLQQPGLVKAHPELLDWLLLTLEQIQQQHLHDHVFGGFFRYTIDPDWQIPHFEKMLYDNAQLAEIFLLAGEQFQRADFAATAQSTIQYLTSQISPKTHLAYASQSALDHQQQDGGRYLWRKSELQQILNPTEFALLNQAWLLDKSPPINDSWLPKPLENPAWEQIKTKLQNRPAVTDNKQLLGWNGLLLSALALNYQIQPTAENFALADNLAQALNKIIEDNLGENQLPKAINDQQQPLGTADLQDFAYLIRGLRAWQSANSANFNKQTNQNTEQNLQKLLQTAQQFTATRPGYNLPNPQAVLTCQPTSIKIFDSRQDPLWLYLEFLNPCNH